VKVERLISVHFPKAGGTSLLKQLTNEMPDQIALDYEHDPLTTSECDRGAFPADKRVVHGHFRPTRYETEAAYRLTFLREPVRNLISIFYFWLEMPEVGNPVHIRFLRERPDIIEFARYRCITGLMSHTYFGGFDMNQFDFIGFHESRDRDIVRLGEKLGILLRPDVHENISPAPDLRQALEANHRAMNQLREILRDDVEFYEKLRSSRG
jgi:hypothetical protein